MLSLLLPGSTPLRVLALGAHADDIEIGCGGTLLTLAGSGREIEWTWAVLSGSPERHREAEAGARAVVPSGHRLDLRLATFRDGFFPAEWSDIKEWLEQLATSCDPHLILTHRRSDRHQDHRTLAELTWNTWRDHLIFEYEVPKYEGDLARPNCYVPLSREAAEAKADLLDRVFLTQRGRGWFDRETFLALLRLRGLECRAPGRYAEGFEAAKLPLSLRPPGS